MLLVLLEVSLAAATASHALPTADAWPHGRLRRCWTQGEEAEASPPLGRSGSMPVTATVSHHDSTPSTSSISEVTEEAISCPKSPTPPYLLQ